MRILAKLGLCLAIAGASTPAVADIVFNGTAIPSTDITSITVDPVTGDVIVTAINDWSVQQGTEPPTEPPPEPPPPPPPSEGLYAKLYSSATEINQYENVTFSWQTVDAVRCVTRLGNAEWQSLAISPLAEGTAVIPMSEAGVEIPFRVFCFDAANNQVATQVKITVNAAPPPEPETPTTNTASCDGPSDVANGIIESWNTTFVSNGFPDINQAVDDHFIGSSNYFAIRFETTDANVSGAVTTVALSGGVRNVSISECPGNFITDTPSTCSQLQGIGEALQYSTDPTSTRCVLDKNKQYYINITQVDVTNRLAGETSTCDSRECLVRLQASAKLQ